MVRLAIIALLITAVHPLALAQKLKAKANRSTVMVGELFKLTYVLDENGSNFRAPKLDKFQLRSGPHESYHRQWINGKFSSNTSYTLHVTAKQEGEFTIPPATVKVKGKIIKSDPVTVKVVKSAPKPGKQAENSSSIEDQINANLFMKLFVDKQEAFLGEQIVATYKLYINCKIVDHNVNELPVFNGFYAQDVELPNGSEMSEEILNGKRFQVATLKRVILFPQQHGDLEIPPFEMDMAVQINDRRRPKNMMEQFLGTHRNVPVQVQSNRQVIKVKDLPREGQPSDFSGAVGDYNLTLNVDKETLDVNEAVNLSVTISGKGNLELITDPGITFPNDFESYDPKVKENINVTAAGVKGKKTFEYVLIPRFSGSYTLEPISLSYFNPETGSYERAESMPITFNVNKDKNAPDQNVAYSSTRKEEVEVIGRDIRFIKTANPELESASEPFYGSTAFIALSAVPFAGMGLAVLLFSLFRVRNSDVQGTKKRNAKSIAKRRLAKAQKAVNENDEAFFDEIHKALLDYLSDKLSLPRADMNRERFTEMLTAQRVSESVMNELNSCLNDCEMVRFAPGAVRGKDEVLIAAERVINALENELA